MSASPSGAIGVMAAQCSATSPRGVMVAAAPTAAVIGASVLRRGGNAFDAVVAAALAETVLLPPKCGLAGDLVALAWERGGATPSALLAIGGAPAGLPAVAAAGALTETGPMSVGVPGAPAGYLALAARGRIPLTELAQPAIDLARGGFSWAAICTTLAAESRELVMQHLRSKTRYFPAGGPIRPGTAVTLPGLAAALERFVSDRDGFLAGPVGAAIVSRVAAGGGVLTMDDLATAANAAEWCAPAGGAGSAGPVWATPAPTHGPSLLAALSRLDDFSQPTAGHVLDAVHAAIAERQLSLADSSGTSMVSAVDGDGTMVAVVHSNSYPRFGSGLIVDEYDLILANRAGRGFSTDPDHPNFPASGRRPATTLHAWAWHAGDGRRVLGGTPGGANQMPWNVQGLTRLRAGDWLTTGAAEALGDAIVAPRWQLDPGGELVVEDGFTVAERAALGRSDRPVLEVGRWGLRSAMQIVADDGGRRSGAVDPRTVGAVLPV